MTDYLTIINILLLLTVSVIMYRCHKGTQDRIHQLESKFLEYLKMIDRGR